MTAVDAVMADMEYRLQIAQRRITGDAACARYLIENRARLLPKMLEAAAANGEDSDYVVARFARGVHARHVEGLL